MKEGVGSRRRSPSPRRGRHPPLGPSTCLWTMTPPLGPANAKVTIIEFSDFQCPYCARFQAQTLPQILQNYGDKVRFVYRNFPHESQQSVKAAEAADCANEQGAFWKYHDLLFQNQSALDDASLKGYASSLGLDTAAFNTCLDTDKYLSELQKDYQDAIAAGAQGTPAFAVGVSAGQFVNAALIYGAQPYSVFQAAIEAALAAGG